MSWAALSIAATLGAGPVLAADSTTAPRPALIYQLPDSKRCGTLTTACDIPKDVNAGGQLNSSSVNSTNVTATGGVSAPVITAPSGGPIQANVTNAANADKAKDADNATNAQQAVNATNATKATLATTANNLSPTAQVPGGQIVGPVDEANSIGGGSTTGTAKRVRYCTIANCVAGGSGFIAYGDLLGCTLKVGTSGGECLYEPVMVAAAPTGAGGEHHDGTGGTYATYQCRLKANGTYVAIFTGLSFNSDGGGYTGGVMTQEKTNTCYPI